MSKKAWYKNMFAVKERFIRKQVNIALARLDADDSAVHSTLDHILKREEAMAEKQGRQPDYRNQNLIDDIFGNVVAGHDTTSSALAWDLKYLTDNPTAQAKLRAAGRGQAPSLVDMTGAKVHYLDAGLEVLRLGHRIPKGVVVILVSNGPSFYSPAFSIDDGRRSSTALAAAPRSWQWEEEEAHVFCPERWLNSHSKFDATAVPQLVFGLGTRSCFGKRLAYLEMKIVATMIIWNFDLLRLRHSAQPLSSGDQEHPLSPQCSLVVHEWLCQGRVHHFCFVP